MLKRKPLFLMLMCIVVPVAGCSLFDKPCDNRDYRGSFMPSDITIRETVVNGFELMELMDESLTFIDPDNVKWVAPKNTLTDGASVPRLALPISGGKYEREFLKAAIVHDAYCQEDNKERCPIQYKSRPWKDVHRMFYRACLAGGTSCSKAQTMYAAVLIGGPRWDDPASDLQTVSNEVLIAEFDGVKKFIQENEPTFEEVETWIGDREPTIIQVSKLESRAVLAMSEGNLLAVDAALQRADRLLTKALGEIPNDPTLLNLKGYQHKNMAIQYSKQSMVAREEAELNKAEQTFQKLIRIEPQNQSALMGMSEVQTSRKDMVRAEEYFRRAEEVEPNRAEAMRESMRLERLDGPSR